MQAGQRLRCGLVRNKLPKAAFARLLGRDRTYVSHLITGRARPSLVIAARIERLTAAWGDCAIRATDWVLPEELAPESAAAA